MEEEVWILEKFQKLYSKIPIDNVVKCESPDFIAYSLGLKIGIEITQVFQDSNIEQHSKLQQYSSDSASLTNQLIAEIQPFIDFTFSIGIDYSKSLKIRKVTRNQLIKKLLGICIPEMLKLQNFQHIDLNNFGILPPEVEHIHISRFDKMESSFDSRPEGGIVRDLTIEYIDFSL